MALLSGREKAKALEYARSQGWVEPALCMSCRETAQQQGARIAELEARLDTEDESHAVTRNTVLRQRDRIAALESEIEQRDKAIAGLRKRRRAPAGEES